MRSILTGLMVSCVAGAALAQPAIQLAPLGEASAVRAEGAQNFTGSCGGAVVRVMGVREVVGNFFTIDLDAGRVIIRSGPSRELVIDTDSGLSDHNGLACVETKGGARLLIWSQCGGSACPDSYSYAVVDVARTKILTPDPKSQDCDADCAARLLDGKRPEAISGD